MTPNETQQRLSAELEKLATRLQSCAERIRDGCFKGETYDVDDEVEGIAMTLIECGAASLVTAVMSGVVTFEIPDFDDETTARATEYAQIGELQSGDLPLFEGIEPHRVN